MSAEVLSNLSGALAQTYGTELVRIWNRAAVLLSMVSVKPGFGKNLAWNAISSGASAASFAEGADVSTYAYDPAQAATLSWGQYQSAFQISNLEIQAAASTLAGGNPEELRNIVMERMFDSAAKMASVINADLFAGTGSDLSSNPTIIGLDTAGLATGTYAGIDKSSVTEWQGNVLSNGGTKRSLTVDLLNNLEQNIFTNSGESPDLIVCSPGVWRKYAGLFESIRRVPTEGGGGVSTYDTMASRLAYKGIPIVRDRNATANSLYMLNTNYLELRPLPQVASKDGVIVTSQMLPSSNGKMSGMTSLPVFMYPLARTGSAIKFVIEVYLQMAMRRPNAFGILKDIDES